MQRVRQSFIQNQDKKITPPYEGLFETTGLPAALTE
jgi:hypothetical protein